ncbi:thermonuclease family protein [Aminobacter sp. HY435]|uniref:thermonuclease family protein n=1 Tax=Aminobacter sp. HY435 TaxID=2970917 RepID=UPI0022B99C22|nr:thermonuclease family protein [Aminobacter sp. HY435]
MRIRKVSTFALFAVAAVTALPSEAKRRQAFAGPVSAVVVEVIDGDTFLADADIWPGQTLRVNIRIRGIDAPEMKSRCPAERSAAVRAREALAQLMSGGAVSLSNIGGAKYYGRVLADVRIGNGAAVGDAMLDEGLVRRYGGGKRDSWCG